MATKHGLRRYKGAGLRPAGMSAAVGSRLQQGQLVKRNDGTIVEMRPGFRPRVLSREEVEALKAQGGSDA